VTELPDFNALDFVMRVLPLVDGLRSMTETSPVTDQTAAVLTALFGLSLSPTFADVFLPWVFENLESLDFDESFGLMAVLLNLLRCSSVQHIMIALMIRYDWPRMFVRLVAKRRESPLFLNALLELLLVFTKAALGLRAGLFSSAAVISELPTPFSSLFDAMPSLSSIELLAPFSHLQNRDRIYLCDSIKKVTDPRTQSSSTSGQDILTHLEPESCAGECPPCFSSKCFDQLPDITKAAILHNSLPRIKKPMNAQVHRFLMGQPAWIAQWIATRPGAGALLLPSHYAQLARAIEALNDLEPATEEYDTETYAYSFMSFPELYDTLISLAHCPSKCWEHRRILLLDLFAVVSEAAQPAQWLRTAVAEFVKADRSCRTFSNFVSLLPPIAHSIDMNVIFEMASRKRVRGDVAMTRGLLSVALRSPRFVCSSAFMRFVTVTIFNATVPVLAVLLPAIRRVEAPEMKDMLRSYLRVAAASNILSPELIFFVRNVSSELLHEEEEVIIPVLRRLISEMPQETLVIDRIFAVLGTNRPDGPSDAAVAPFWQVVSEHREFVSARVTSEPRLLESGYSFISKYPCLLSFSARFKKFAGRIRDRRSRIHCSVNVRRAEILGDSFQQLHHLGSRTWLGVIHVSFANEPGIDGGGLLREWLSCLTMELFRPGHALFLPTLSKRSFQPNPCSAINPKHLAYFEFAGKVFAVAVVNSVHLSAHLSMPFLKRIIGKTLSLEDLADIDEMMFNGMKWILENSVADLPSELVFSASAAELGSGRQVELKENGASIAVTDANKQEYIELLVEHRLKREIEHQGNAFCQGFYELIPLDEIKAFDAAELDAVICGENIVDVSDWQKHCEFMGVFSANHPVIALFFEVLRSWSQENLSKLLAFTTGSPQVPLGGFAAFREAGRPIVINSGGGKDRLVTAHTCVNTLDLPLYESRSEMNEKLMYAIENCAGYGFK
jgi:hypothetical protein